MLLPIDCGREGFTIETVPKRAGMITTLGLETGKQITITSSPNNRSVGIVLLDETQALHPPKGVVQ